VVPLSKPYKAGNCEVRKFNEKKRHKKGFKTKKAKKSPNINCQRKVKPVLRDIEKQGILVDNWEVFL